MASRTKRRRRLRRIRKWLIFEIKRVNRCNVCGVKRHLTFHHRDRSEKAFAISYKIGKNVTWHKLFGELRKCDIVCRKCHEMIHQKERKGENNV